MNDRIDPTNEVDSGDEPMSNHSNNPHFSTILDKRLSRRQVLTGSLSAAIAGVFGAAGAATMANAAGPECSTPAAKDRPPFGLNPTLGFDAIPVTRSDNATVPYGYKVQALVPWGTPINGSTPAYDGVNGNSGADQELQVGSHHDGMHYFRWPMTRTDTGCCA